MRNTQQTLGMSGRIAAAFQANALTPLLALVALLLGIFAVVVTPREEEPQINVTMANVLIAFPGASSADVQNMVAKPAELVYQLMPEALLKTELEIRGRRLFENFSDFRRQRVIQGQRNLGQK